MNTREQSNLPEILTFKEYRQAIKCSRSTGYRLIWNGTVQAIKIGGRLRILTASVAHLLTPKGSDAVEGDGGGNEAT